MTQIRIKRLAAGHREKHRPQRHQSDRSVREQEMDGVPWIDRRQHRRIVADVNEAHHREGREPDDHDRPKGRCDTSRTAALNREQHDQDEYRQRHDKVLERGRRELETFHRGQHRNCRRDHGIADKHRCAEHAQRQQWPASAAQCALAQRHQRKRTALAVIVSAQQQQNVFCGDDDKKRPQDQGQNPEHNGPRYRLALRSGGGSHAKRIQWRGSDIAKDDANASQRQGPKARRDRPVMGFG